MGTVQRPSRRVPGNRPAHSLSGRERTVVIVYPVEIETRYSKDFQTKESFSAQWQRVLGRSKFHNAVVKCCCPGIGDKRLAVRYYEESDTFGLARYPMTGEEHANDCRFYAPNPEKSGLSGYEKGVVEEANNGFVKIRLGIGLTKKSPSDDEVPPQPRSLRGPSRQQAKMSLLGLLHFLWDRAGLNVWWPAMEGKRDSGLVNAKLREVASEVRAGRVGLDQVLLLAAPSKESRLAEPNQKRVADATEKSRRLLLIAPLAAYKPDQATDVLRIAGFGGIPFLDMNARLWETVSNRYPRAVSAWKDGFRVFVIAQVEGKENTRYARVLDCALMAVTDQWIPVESGFEKRIADKLTDEKRAFYKPLRFDAGEEDVFPDFILRDTGADTPLEVFGRSDEPYQARRAIKERYYADKFGVRGWWCWSAVHDPLGQRIPPFPDRKG